MTIVSLEKKKMMRFEDWSFRRSFGQFGFFPLQGRRPIPSMIWVNSSNGRLRFSLYVSAMERMAEQHLILIKHSWVIFLSCPFGSAFEFPILM